MAFYEDDPSELSLNHLSHLDISTECPLFNVARLILLPTSDESEFPPTESPQNPENVLAVLMYFTSIFSDLDAGLCMRILDLPFEPPLIDLTIAACLKLTATSASVCLGFVAKLLAVMDAEPFTQWIFDVFWEILCRDLVGEMEEPWSTRPAVWGLISALSAQGLPSSLECFCPYFIAIIQDDEHWQATGPDDEDTRDSDCCPDFIAALITIGGYDHQIRELLLMPQFSSRCCEYLINSEVSGLPEQALQLMRELLDCCPDFIAACTFEFPPCRLFDWFSDDELEYANIAINIALDLVAWRDDVRDMYLEPAVRERLGFILASATMPERNCALVFLNGLLSMVPERGFGCDIFVDLIPGVFPLLDEDSMVFDDAVHFITDFCSKFCVAGECPRDLLTSFTVGDTDGWTALAEIADLSGCEILQDMITGLNER
jgi:hypothetical protein